MTEPTFSRWLKKVAETQETEIDCSACLAEISDYVDRELANGDAAASMPHVNHHLNQCAICFDEYQVLRDLARLESVDALPDMEALRQQLQRDPNADA